MAWTTPRTYVADEILTAAILNADHKANLDVLSTHAHSGAAGMGSSSLGNLVKETFTDASAPAAPGAGLTALYTVSGRPHFRAGAGGSDTTLAILSDVHAQAHASAHEPGGADAMAVDAATSTASLRTLGSGSTQGAAGDHTHTIAEESNHVTNGSQPGSAGMAVSKGHKADIGDAYSTSDEVTNTFTVVAGERQIVAGCAVINKTSATNNYTHGVRVLVDDGAVAAVTVSPSTDANTASALGVIALVAAGQSGSTKFACQFKGGSDTSLQADCVGASVMVEELGI